MLTEDEERKSSLTPTHSPTQSKPETPVEITWKEQVMGTFNTLAGGKPFCGQANYFLSHAWGYKLGDLRDLVRQHYENVTGKRYAYAPIYYWIDIFAVSQNFCGNFNGHPDGNFSSVIKDCESLVFTMQPWEMPLAPRRAWCLFEAVTAIK
jgi:hypothetical protein